MPRLHYAYNVQVNGTFKPFYRKCNQLFCSLLTLLLKQIKSRIRDALFYELWLESLRVQRRKFRERERECVCNAWKAEAELELYS